jgi:hypothetical protein
VIVGVASSAALAAIPYSIVPEVDASTGVAAVSLLAGAALVIRGRRSK